MIITVIVWMLLLLVLGAGTTFAVLAFHRPERLLTWAAGAAVIVALVLAWLAHSTLPPVLGVLVALAGSAMAVFGGGPAAVLALQLATKGSVPEGTHGGIVLPVASVADGVAPTEYEVLRGGTTIGVLERFATVATIIAGFPEGLAVIVAVKGVGRFTELSAAESRERFIIGTLASLTWACLCGAIIRLAAF
ncbi:MAG: hypothetical protein ABWY36_01805 [Leifsonia sp.]